MSWQIQLLRIIQIKLNRRDFLLIYIYILCIILVPDISERYAGENKIYGRSSLETLTGDNADLDSDEHILHLFLEKKFRII